MPGFGLDISVIAPSWKDCTGYADLFPSSHIESYVTFPSSGFDSRTWAEFTSPRLKEPLFYEIQHYVDRSLYHLILGKWMVCRGRITWGLVSYYYSSFFAAQAAIRLKGLFFVKVNYDSETVVPPTHRLEVCNLVTNRFRIRRAGGAGEHQRLWKAFYAAYEPVSARDKYAKYSAVMAETDPELRVVEMHRRHLLNYVPGCGYLEIRSAKNAKDWQDKLSCDVHDNRSRSLSDPDCQLEVRAFLRLELCLQILNDIASQGGAYSIHHPKLTGKRKKMLSLFDCPDTLSSRVETALLS